MITETLYYLAVVQKPSFIPTQIQVVTITEGANRIRLNLLNGPQSPLKQLCRDYGLASAAIRFEASSLIIIAHGERALSDIRTPEDNERVADLLIEHIRQLTDQPHTAIHASVAGGRKTMGVCLGYAMSLLGRPQDRLSHVLVSPEFEGESQFYYPTPQASLFNADRAKRTLDASRAQVTLADIPFVRLRHEIVPGVLTPQASYSELVQRAQQALQQRLLIELTERHVVCGRVAIELAAKTARLLCLARPAGAAKAAFCLFIRGRAATVFATLLHPLR